ncbi:putative toxin-antitoxin system toxin component, PIN family, partial [Synechocystis sp. LEGE 06083]
MNNEAIRAVIDTNIWISFLIGKTLQGLNQAIIDNRVVILFSEDLFVELMDVLYRPKFKKYFSETAIQNLVALLNKKVELVKINFHFDSCRDKKDNFLLDLAVSGNANYLVTGDSDLLALNPFQTVKIVSYQHFQTAILAM